MNKLLILSLLVATLLLASCATNPGNSAGKVNGTFIPNDEFINAYRGHFANFSYSMERSPDPDEKVLLFKETWKNITRYVILKDYYQKYKITANAREVIDTLSSSIPAHILTSPLFKTDGKFDNRLYLQSLLTDIPENLAPLRRHYQENLIPILKLQTKLIENELISTSESKQIARILSSSADMDMFIFDPAEVQVVISENEIASFYSSNLSRYSLKPYHKLAYSLVPVTPDNDDNLLSKVLADSVCQALNNGVKAQDIIHSANSSSGLMTLVDNGYVKTAELPSDLEQGFSLLPDGACTTPTKTDTGWVIHQKLQSTKTLTQYRTIMVQSLARTSTLASPQAKAKNLMNLALSIGLKDAADEFELSYTTQGEQLNPDSLSFNAPEIKNLILSKLKTSTTGSILEPLYSTTLSAWIVIEVLEKQSREVQALEEVSSLIKSELTESRRNELNLQRAQSWSNTRLLSSYAPPSTRLSGVTINTVWENQPLGNLYYQAIQAHLAETDAPALQHNGVLVVPIVQELTFTKETVPAAAIRNAYVHTLPAGWFDKWLESKVKEAKVFIYNAP